ncbi:hypothetical protein Tco_0381477 [Tanacetum coccineum]
MGNVSVPELSSLGGRIPRAGVAIDSGAITTSVDNVGAHTASSSGRIVMDNVGAHTASSSNGIATIMDNVGADIIIVPYFSDRTSHADIIVCIALFLSYIGDSLIGSDLRARSSIGNWDPRVFRSDTSIWRM